MELVRGGQDDLPELYEQMKQNFVREEIRDYADAARVFADKRYTLYHIVEGERVGFMCVWELGDFTFLEHFVIYKRYRGKGYGGQAFDLLKQKSKLLVLECEPPTDELTIRRVNFYTRHGMILNAHPYRQPPYRAGGEGCELKLMTSTPADLTQIISTLYKEVYKTQYEQ